MRYESVAFQQFLLCGRFLDFAPGPAPAVSIVVVLFNKAPLTLSCLASIHAWAPEAEVILVDNGSTDPTPQLLDRLRGVQTLRNRSNLGFVAACNQGARMASGRHLAFLNNDAALFPDTVRAAAGVLDRGESIGAVGAKIVRPDGTLQEAGSIIWRDGTCLGYGRGDDPFAPEYMFRRDVDFCSGAFLMTPRGLFEAMGGFEEAYAPMYYEDADYCWRLAEQGYRVVYDPGVVILHREFSSSGSPQEALRVMEERRRLFFQRHERALESQWPACAKNVLAARTPPRRKTAGRVLYVDDAVPLPCSGAGLPRGNEIVKALVSLGYDVTIYPTEMAEEAWEEVYRHLPAGVEIMLHRGPAAFQAFLAERRGAYGTLFVCRPGNMDRVARLMRKTPGLFDGVRVIYDSEAVYALREMARLRLLPRTRASGRRHRRLRKEIRKELRLGRKAHRTVAVNEIERRLFLEQGVREVTLLRHAVDAEPTPSGFAQRKDFLFVGAIWGDLTPNADAVLWFLDEVLPLLNRRLEDRPRIRIAGLNRSDAVRARASDQVEVVGRVELLRPLYDACRVFVAPNRYSAGIPLKVIEAAAFGVPAVATSPLAEQLAWTHGQELLAADPADPASFAHCCAELYTREELWRTVRRRSLERVRTECGRKGFRDSLEGLLRFAEASDGQRAPAAGRRGLFS